MDLIIKNNIAHWGPHRFACTYGRHGFADVKQEADGKTPIGVFPFRRVFYRADRIEMPRTALPLDAIAQDCGWCDDPKSEQYNRYIKKPFAGSHEDLWLDRPIYDLIIVVGHNDDPPTAGQGSAIFIHLSSPDNGPTQGCIGLQKEALLQVLAECSTSSRLMVEG